MENLQTQLAPTGTLEEMLTEKIAVAYWRLRRAYKYEVGLIRDESDNAKDKFYSETTYRGDKKNKTDEEIKCDYKIQLTTTPCNLGGVRYWFICPMRAGMNHNSQGLEGGDI